MCGIYILEGILIWVRYFKEGTKILPNIKYSPAVGNAKSHNNNNNNIIITSLANLELEKRDLYKICSDSTIYKVTYNSRKLRHKIYLNNLMLK